MKKMNKMYEAPKAEVIEINNVAVLMGSATETGGFDDPTGGDWE